ncbi:MAG TPA: DNA-3-methyladenine glycosylase [Anaerolineae bacterium]|nr:DNA-3-methyladenine glycosylase [Anaerolineae bacterium]
MIPYCQYVKNHPEDEYNRIYHDTEYGFPLEEDALLFERLILEINQAGLSWITILKKKDNFRRAYHAFDIDRVAGYDQLERERLLADAGIIRNRLKINAAIENAKQIQSLRMEYGSFKGWLDAHTFLSKLDWVNLFKQIFTFTGGEIVGEFLMSTGYLPGAHDPDCPVFQQTAALKPAWIRSKHDQRVHI